MAKHEVDRELEFIVDAGLGASDPFYEDEIAQRLVRRADQEAWSSPDGRELRARVGQRFDTFVAQEVQKRFGDNPYYPGVAFRSRVEEVIHDLLLAETSPKPLAPKVNLTVDPPKPKPTEAHTKFAYAFNHTVQTKGIAAIKPAAGIVTLEMNGRSYEYDAKTADRLFNECAEFQLIK